MQLVLVTARALLLQQRELGVGGLTLQRLALECKGERLRVGPSGAAASDLSLRASLPGLLGLVGLTRAGSGQGLPTGQVQIAGDAELLRKIERLGRRFDPDWELALANRLGPVFGPQLARQVRAAFAWLKTSGQSLAESSAEYLSEEGKDSIARAEQDEFAQQVAELRDGVERAEARLVRLAAKLGRP